MINSKDIERNNIKWASVDTFAPLLKSNDAFIINTDIDKGAGIHWIVMKRFNDIILIIDPLGPYNHRPYDNIMFDILKNYNVKLYDGAFQYSDSYLCGWFSIFICKLINAYKSTNINDVDLLINQYFGRTADENDVKILVNAFGLLHTETEMV